MAEAILNHISKGVDVKAESAGFDPAGGSYMIDQNVIKVLNEKSIETDYLKVKKVTENMLRDSDKIVTFRCIEKLPSKYQSKAEDWQIGRKRKSGQKQSERTIEELRKMRDAIYKKVNALVKKM
jgi:protein-tyrosine-phosphatase